VLPGQSGDPVHGVVRHDPLRDVIRRGKSGKQGISPCGEPS